MPAPKNPTDAILKELRDFGLAHYPGAHTKSPWPGHLDLAVNDKTFAYLSVEGEPFSISCKLPHSNSVALMLPFTKPTAYGLGKSGWVSAKFDDGEIPPVDMLKEWIDESYRAQAPKKLVNELTARTSPTAATAKPAAAKKVEAKKVAVAKPAAAKKVEAKKVVVAKPAAAKKAAAKKGAVAKPAATKKATRSSSVSR